jgi:hypothetical protein
MILGLYLYSIPCGPWCFGQLFLDAIHHCTTDAHYRNNNASGLHIVPVTRRHPNSFPAVGERIWQRSPKNLLGDRDTAHAYCSECLTLAKKQKLENHSFRCQTQVSRAPRCHTSVFVTVTNWCSPISRSCSPHSLRRATSPKSNATTRFFWQSRVGRRYISPSETRTKKRFRFTKTNFNIHLGMLT